MHTPALEGLKVITAEEMARIEKLAYADVSSEQTFMENAGAAIAAHIVHFVNLHHVSKDVILLVGKGNNGGDAFAAGCKLIEQGIQVTALHLYPLEECSPLCRKMHDKFRSVKGTIHLMKGKTSFDFGNAQVILDGLVGTGFRGKAEGALALSIEKANQSGLPILAIDIPSGLNGTTGEVQTIAIRATETIFLGLPKLGFFLKEGWDHVGKLRYASFGLKEKYIAEARASQNQTHTA
jgi:hydroxyethylthiazole kinase-like uncharacterized protein yjeF